MTNRMRIVLVMACAAVVACKSDSPYFGTTKLTHPANVIYMGTGSEPDTLDPGAANEGVGLDLVRNMFEGLHAYDPKTAGPIPGVAKSFKVSDDGLKYTFFLRNDVKWSDGKRLTARDFEWTWRRNLLPELASQYAFLLHDLKNGQAVNEGGLAVLDEEARLLRDAVDGSPVVARLGKGTLVEVKEGNRRVVRDFGFSLFGDKQTHEIKFNPDKPRNGEGAGGAVVTVISKEKDDVTCNGQKSRWYRVKLFEKPGTDGYLPGCLLAHDAKKIRGDAAADRDLVTVKGSGVEGWVATDRHRPALEEIGVRAVDDYTLEVRLERPVPFFVDLTQFGITVPVRRDAVEAGATKEERAEAERRRRPYLLWASRAWARAGRMVVNGPYNLTEWVLNDRYVFDKNPHYWDAARMKIDRIVSITSDDNTAMLNFYQAGRLDWPGSNVSIPIEYLSHVKTKKDYVDADYLGSYFFWVNVKAKPVDDVRVRRALNMAIDKEKLTKYVLKGGQQPTRSLVPPGTGRGYVPAEGDPYDIERAKALLAEAGFPAGNGLPKIELTYNTDEGHRKIAEAVHQMWKRDLGIDVDIVNQEWKVFNKNLETKNYQIGRMGWIGDYDEPYTFLSICTSSSGQNNSGWSSKEFDDLLDNAVRERDQARRYALYRKAEEIVVRELPILPVYIYRRHSLVKPYLRGWYPNILDIHPIKDMWIDPS